MYMAGLYVSRRCIKILYNIIWDRQCIYIFPAQIITNSYSDLCDIDKRPVCGKEINIMIDMALLFGIYR